MTNADKIRGMTDEELVAFMGSRPDSCPPIGVLCSGKNCYDCWLDWLKQEASAPPKKEPICLSCAHASFSATDDFADCLCAVRGGYEGGKTECKDYERRCTD